MADEQTLEGGLLEEVGINLVVEEAARFKTDLDSSRGALNAFAQSVGDFTPKVADFNAAMLRVSTTLYTVNQRSGNIGKLTAALTAFTKIPETAARITGFASGAARELDAIALSMARIATETQKTVSAIKAADLSGAMATEMRKAMRDATDKATREDKEYFAAAVSAMVARGMDGVRFEGDGGAFKTQLQKVLVGAIADFAKGGGMSRAMRNLAEGVEDAAEFIGPSIASGIASGQGEAVKSVTALGKAVEGALRNTLDIHSESPELVAVGKWIPLSIAAGIEQGTPVAVAAARSSATKIAAAVQESFKTMSGAGGGLQIRIDESTIAGDFNILAKSLQGLLDNALMGGMTPAIKQRTLAFLDQMEALVGSSDFMEAAMKSNMSAFVENLKRNIQATREFVAGPMEAPSGALSRTSSQARPLSELADMRKRLAEAEGTRRLTLSNPASTEAERIAASAEVTQASNSILTALSTSLKSGAKQVALDLEATGKTAQDRVFEIAISYVGEDGKEVSDSIEVGLPKDMATPGFMDKPGLEALKAKFESVRNSGIDTTLDDAIRGLAKSLQGTTEEVILIGHNLDGFDLKVLAEMGYGAEKLKSIFAEYGVKIVDTFDTWEAMKILRGGTADAGTIKGAAGGFGTTLPEAFEMFMGRRPDVSHTAATDAATNAAIGIPLVKALIGKLELQDRNRTLTGAVGRATGAYTAPVLDDPFGQKAVATQRASAAAAEAQADASELAAAANRAAAAATSGVAEESKKLDAGIVALIEDYKATQGAARTARNRAYNPEAIQKNAFDTIRAVAGTRGYVPGTGKNEVSMGHGAGYIDTSGPEYQRMMREFVEGGGKITDLFAPPKGARKPTQASAQMNKVMAERRQQFLDTYSPITTTQPWQKDVKPPPGLQSEDIDTLNLFVDTAIEAFFADKMDMANATAKDIGDQLRDKKTGAEFASFVKGSSYGFDKSTDILKYAKMRTSAKAGVDRKIEEGTYQWVESEVSNEYKRLKEILARSGTVAVMIEGITQYDRELTASYKAKAAEIRQAIDAATKAGDTNKLPDLQNALAMYQELGSRTDRTISGQLSELGKKRADAVSSFLDNKGLDAKAIQAARAEAEQLDKDLKLAQARYDAAPEGYDKIGMQDELRDLMAKRSAFVEGLVASSTAGLEGTIDASGIGAEIARLSDDLAKIEARGGVATETRAAIERLLQARSRILEEKREEVRAFLLGGADALPQVKELDRLAAELESRSIADPSLRAAARSLERLDTDRINGEMARNVDAANRLMELVNGDRKALEKLLRTYEESVALETRQTPGMAFRADTMEIAFRGGDSEAIISGLMKKNVTEFGALMRQKEQYTTGAGKDWGAAQVKNTIWDMVGDRNSPLTRMALEYTEVVDEFAARIAVQEDIMADTKASAEQKAAASDLRDNLRAATANLPIFVSAVGEMTALDELAELKGAVAAAPADILSGKAKAMLTGIIEAAINGDNGIAKGIANLRDMAAAQLASEISAMRSGSTLVPSPAEMERMKKQIPWAALKNEALPLIEVARKKGEPEGKLGKLPSMDRPEPDFTTKVAEEAFEYREMVKGTLLNLQQEQEGLVRLLEQGISKLREKAAVPGVDVAAINAEITDLATQMANANARVNEYKDHIKKVNAAIRAQTERMEDQTITGVGMLRVEDFDLPDRSKYDLEMQAELARRDQKRALARARAKIVRPSDAAPLDVMTDAGEQYISAFSVALKEALGTYLGVVKANMGVSMARQAKDLGLPEFSKALKSSDVDLQKQARSLFRQGVTELDFEKLNETLTAVVPAFLNSIQGAIDDVMRKIQAQAGPGEEAQAQVEEVIKNQIMPLTLAISTAADRFKSGMESVKRDIKRGDDPTQALDALFRGLQDMKALGDQTVAAARGVFANFEASGVQKGIAASQQKMLASELAQRLSIGDLEKRLLVAKGPGDFASKGFDSAQDMAQDISLLEEALSQARAGLTGTAPVVQQATAAAQEAAAATDSMNEVLQQVVGNLTGAATSAEAAAAQAGAQAQSATTVAGVRTPEVTRYDIPHGTPAACPCDGAITKLGDRIVAAIEKLGEAGLKTGKPYEPKYKTEAEKKTAAVELEGARRQYKGQAMDILVRRAGDLQEALTKAFETDPELLNKHLVSLQKTTASLAQEIDKRFEGVRDIGGMGAATKATVTAINNSFLRLDFAEVLRGADAMAGKYVATMESLKQRSKAQIDALELGTHRVVGRSGASTADQDRMADEMAEAVRIANESMGRLFDPENMGKMSLQEIRVRRQMIVDELREASVQIRAAAQEANVLPKIRTDTKLLEFESSLNKHASAVKRSIDALKVDPSEKAQIESGLNSLLASTRQSVEDIRASGLGTISSGTEGQAALANELAALRAHFDEQALVILEGGRKAQAALAASRLDEHARRQADTILALASRAEQMLADLRSNGGLSQAAIDAAANSTAKFVDSIKASVAAAEQSAIGKSGSEQQNIFRELAISANSAFSAIRKELSGTEKAMSSLLETSERVRDSIRNAVGATYEKAKGEVGGRLGYEGHPLRDIGYGDSIPAKAAGRLVEAPTSLILRMLDTEGQFKKVAERVRREAEATAKSYYAQIDKLQAMAVDASGKGLVSKVAAYEAEMKRLGEAAKEAVEAGLARVEKRASAVDKILNFQREMKEWKGDPGKFFKEASIQSAKYGKGFWANLDRWMLTISTGSQALSTAIALVRYQLSMLMKPLEMLRDFIMKLVAPFPWLANQMKSAVSAMTGIGKSAKKVADNLDSTSGKVSRKTALGGKENPLSRFRLPSFSFPGVGGLNVMRSQVGGMPDLKNADKIGEEAGKSIAAGATKEIGKKRGDILGKKNLWSPVGQGIGMGIGFSMTQGIMHAMQNATWQIRSFFQQTISQGMGAVITTETDKLLFQSQATNETALETAGRDFGEVWDEAGEKAEETYDKIRSLAKVSSFGKAPLIDFARQMMTGGMKTGQAVAATQNVTGFLDAFFPGNKQIMKTAGQQLMQMLQQGVMRTQDINILSGAGLPIFRWLGSLPEFAGKTTDEAMKVILDDIEDGGIPMNKAFAAIMNGMVADAKKFSGKAASTLSGMLSTFEDIRLERTEQLMAPIAESLIKPSLEWINELLDSEQAIKWFADLGESISSVSKTIVDAIAGTVGFMVGVWQSIPGPIQDVIVFAGKALAVFTALATAIAAFNAVMFVLGPVLGGIGAAFATLSGGLLSFQGILASAFLAYQRNILGFKSLVDSLVWTIGFKFLNPMGKSLGEGLGEWFMPSDAAAGAVDSGMNIGQRIVDGISGFFRSPEAKSEVEAATAPLTKAISEVDFSATGGAIGAPPTPFSQSAPSVGDAPILGGSSAIQAAESAGTAIGKTMGGAINGALAEQTEKVDPRIKENWEKHRDSALREMESLSMEAAKMGPMPFEDVDPKVLEENQRWLLPNVDFYDMQEKWQGAGEKAATAFGDGMEQASVDTSAWPAAEKAADQWGDRVAAEQARIAEDNKGMFVNLYEEFDAAWGRAYDTIMGWLLNIQRAVEVDFMGWAQGVYSSIYNFFAPIGQFLADAVGSGVDFWNNQVLPATSQFVQGFLDWILAIPENLAKVFDVLVEWGKGVINFFADMVGALGNLISGMFGGGSSAPSALDAPAVGPDERSAGAASVQAAAWGRDAGTAYVDGWSEAGMGGITALGKRIAADVEAHSPPRFLPDLSTWGTAAADAYLEGWLQADFSMMNELASSLISALEADEGGLGEEQIEEIKLAVAQMVDAAVDLGQVDISAIMEAGGDWGGRAEQVRRLAEAYANLAIVQHQSAEATAELEYINTKYDALLGPLQRRLEALQKAQETNTLDEQIAGQQRVIGNIYATEAQREAARLKLEELGLQQQINTLEEERTEQTNPLQDVIDSLALQNLEAQRAFDLVKERWGIEVGGFSSAATAADAATEAAEAAAAAGDEMKRSFEIPEFDKIGQGANDMLSGFQQKVNAVSDEVKKKWEDVTVVFTTLKTTIGKVTENAGALTAKFQEGLDSGIFTQEGGVLGFFQNLGAAALIVSTNVGLVVGSVESLWGLLSRTWNYGPFADQATTSITSEGGGQMNISVPSEDAQQWSQSAGLVTRVEFTLTALVDAAKVGMTSLETEMKAWTTRFSAWWETDGKVKLADVQTQVSDFFKGIPGAILDALGVDQSGSALEINQDVNDAVAGSAGVAGEIASKFISWLSSGIAGVDWTSAGAASTASLFLIAEKLLVWISGFIKETDLAPLAKESGEATGKVIAGAVMGAIFGGVSLAITATEGEGDSSSNLVTRTVSSLVLMVYEFIMGIVNGFAQGIQDKVSTALGVSQEWKQINSGQTAASQEVGAINNQIAQLEFSLLHPEYELPGINTATAEADLENLKLKLSEVYAGDPDTLSKQAQESLKSWALGLTSNNATEEEKKLGKIVWDNISAGGDASGSVDKFIKAMTDYAGTDSAKQEQANLGVALALGIHAGMLNDEVKKDIQGGNGYPAALQKVLKEEFGIKSPSTVFRDEIGRPLGEGILQGMKESLGAASGTVGDLSSGVEGGTETLASVASAAMSAAVLAIDAALLLIGAKWTAFKDSLIATQKSLWAGMKSATDTGLASQEAALTAFTDSWKNVKLPAFRDAVIDLASQIKSGVIAKMQEMIDGVTAKLDEMLAVITSEDNLAKAYDAGAEIGDAIVKGIVEGMTSEEAGAALDDVSEALVDLIKDLIKEAADSNSPSKLMAREVGLPLTQGIAAGMISQAADRVLLDASRTVIAATAGYMASGVPAVQIEALRGIGASRLPGISGGEQIVMHNEVRKEYHLHLTVSPQQAIRTEYNFAVMEAMVG